MPGSGNVKKWAATATLLENRGQLSSNISPVCSLTHSIKYRRDVCFSQSLTALVSALMGRIWCRPADTSFIKILAQIGEQFFMFNVCSCTHSTATQL